MKTPTLRKLLRLPAPERVMLAEAAVYLLLARLALAIIPFKRLIWFFERPPCRREVEEAECVRLCKATRRAIDIAAQQLPGEMVCFPRAIAAQVLLRRRGVDAVIYYGAARLPKRGLTAHTWVQVGEVGVVGHEIASDYLLLARFPGGLVQ